MILEDLDHFATQEETFLHRIPEKYKLSFLIIILFIMLFFPQTYLLLLLYFSLITLIVANKIPLRLTLLPSFYPLLFMFILFFSLSIYSISAILFIALRALLITLTLLTIMATTPFLKIFALLSRLLPSFIITSLFLTYRSLFILGKNFREIRTTLHLRGGLNYRRPFNSLRNLANALGYLVLKSLELSERQAQYLRMRGFNGKIYY